MTKLLSSVGLAFAVAMAFVVAGCQLYFGSNDDDGGGSPPGFPCAKDGDCAAGCYCEDGKCAEAGFCGDDKDCGAGFHCDKARSSCVPNPVCSGNEQCAKGSVCDNGGCVSTCVCTSDADALRQGAGWCDEVRGTCMPGTDPAGACTGAITCTTAAPKCAIGEVALRKDGCFTGQCRAISACEAAPECKAIQHEADCLTRNADCSVLTLGRDCHRPDGSDCQSGDMDCVCRIITFQGCTDRT